MEPPCAPLLRGHVKRALKCADFLNGVVGLGHALTRSLQYARHRSTGPSLRRVVLSRRSSVVRPAPTPSALPWTSVWPYTRACFRRDRPRHRVREGLPVDRPAFPACRLPYAGAVPGCSRIHGPDCCLRLTSRGSAHSVPHGLVFRRGRVRVRYSLQVCFSSLRRPDFAERRRLTTGVLWRLPRAGLVTRWLVGPLLGTRESNHALVVAPADSD